MDNLRSVFAAFCGAALVQFGSVQFLNHQDQSQDFELQPVVMGQALEAGFGRRNCGSGFFNRPPMIQPVVNQQDDTLVQINENFNKIQFQIDALVNLVQNVNTQPGSKGDPGVRGDPGIQGIPGIPGKDGRSPTVQEILAELDLNQLKGEKGDQGEPGGTPEIDYNKFAIDYSQLNINYNELVNNIDLSQLKGEKGEPGDPGTSPSVDDIIANINFDELRGEKGEPGDPGDPGVDGKVNDEFVRQQIYAYINSIKPDLIGPQGESGKFDITLIDEDGDGVLDELPPFFIRVEDPKGVYSTPYSPVHLGEEVSLVLMPISTPGGIQGGLEIQAGKEGGEM